MKTQLFAASSVIALLIASAGPADATVSAVSVSRTDAIDPPGFAPAWAPRAVPEGTEGSTAASALDLVSRAFPRPGFTGPVDQMAADGNAYPATPLDAARGTNAKDPLALFGDEAWQWRMRTDQIANSSTSFVNIVGEVAEQQAAAPNGGTVFVSAGTGVEFRDTMREAADAPGNTMVYLFGPVATSSTTVTTIRGRGVPVAYVSGPDGSRAPTLSVGEAPPAAARDASSGFGQFTYAPLPTPIRLGPSQTVAPAQGLDAAVKLQPTIQTTTVSPPTAGAPVPGQAAAPAVQMSAVSGSPMGTAAAAIPNGQMGESPDAGTGKTMVLAASFAPPAPVSAAPSQAAPVQANTSQAAPIQAGAAPAGPGQTQYSTAPNTAPAVSGPATVSYSLAAAGGTSARAPAQTLSAAVAPVQSPTAMLYLSNVVTTTGGTPVALTNPSVESYTIAPIASAAGAPFQVASNVNVPMRGSVAANVGALNSPLALPLGPLTLRTSGLVAAVPEPSSLAVLGGALWGLIGIRRTKRA